MSVGGGKFSENLDSREFLLRILGKHCNHNVITYLKFSLVRRCQLDEDISGLKTNFRVVPIDDGWQRADSPLGV